MTSQQDADANALLRIASLLDRHQSQLRDELRAIANRMVGRIDQPKVTRRSVTERVIVNGRTVMIVAHKRAQFGL